MQAGLRAGSGAAEAEAGDAPGRILPMQPESSRLTFVALGALHVRLARTHSRLVALALSRSRIATALLRAGRVAVASLAKREPVVPAVAGVALLADETLPAAAASGPRIALALLRAARVAVARLAPPRHLVAPGIGSAHLTVHSVGVGRTDAAAGLRVADVTEQITFLAFQTSRTRESVVVRQTLVAAPSADAGLARALPRPRIAILRQRTGRIAIARAAPPVTEEAPVLRLQRTMERG